jgi:hypothetical protein
MARNVSPGDRLESVATARPTGMEYMQSTGRCGDVLNPGGRRGIESNRRQTWVCKVSATGALVRREQRLNLADVLHSELSDVDPDFAADSVRASPCGGVPWNSTCVRLLPQPLLTPTCARDHALSGRPRQFDAITCPDE